MQVLSNTTEAHTAALVAADPYCDAHFALLNRVEVDRAGNIWRNCAECDL